MRKIFGVVAEFNPFHNGHKALIAEARRAGYTHCAAVMSGNYVQRGEAAVAEKRVRVKSALLEGVDLVIELPLAYATATAQRFAKGAVTLLNAAGCVEALCFGNECGDLSLLRELAEALDSPAMNLRPYLDAGMTFALARSHAMAEMLGREKAAHLTGANNLLAVEYLRAAKALGWKPEVFTMPRMGIAHDAGEPSGRFASASYLRLHGNNEEALRRFLPARAKQALSDARAEGLYPVDRDKLDAFLFSHLRRLTPSDLAALPDLSEGIQDKLYKAIRSSASMEQLIWSVKSKRYTLARVRRLILHAFLGLTEKDGVACPPYLRILGFNGRGREILSQMKGLARLPVSPSLARLRELGGASARFARLEELSTDLYTAALPLPKPCGYEYTASGIYLKSSAGWEP